MTLLKDLENLDIIKIHLSEDKLDSEAKSSKYRGSISSSTADQLLGHVEKLRNEWEKRFPTK